MAAFPVLDEDRIADLNEQADSILRVFAGHGYLRQEPSILQPAEIFLERSGEEIRRRTYTFTDPAGNELCLRPDLTIPICRAHVARRGSYPARLCYHGLAFRHQPSAPQRPSQFYQAGAELLGVDNRLAAETEVMGLAVEALRATGLAGFELKIGDLGLFADLVDALDVPSQWRGRLKRHFWRVDYFDALLARASSGVASNTQKLLANIGGMEPADARSALEGLMDMFAEAPSGTRTREEIVDRLIEQAADAAAMRLDPAIAAIIADMLAIEGPAEQSLETIRSLTKKARVNLEGPIRAMEERLAALKALGIDPGRIRFAARFGRNMEYYTGFVAEFWSRDAEGPVQVAGGGRYDTLLQALGADRAIPAMGFVIRTERVLAARRFQKRG
ncbi:MAG: ATP phosphoribosyltransferase regulatory subunit [Alphaproteobacteria bacterium]|nr:ATP phosphoribosyltransferase regulatory subunit [Alphaproteobacteria bacterium]